MRKMPPTLGLMGFNTQPPEGGWAAPYPQYEALVVSTHSRLKAAGSSEFQTTLHINVSTHSRLKAAGFKNTVRRPNTKCFNTQPPEGGWILIVKIS